MKHLLLFIGGLFFFAACTGEKSASEEQKSIQIAVAANMQFAMDSIAILFENEHGTGCEVSANSSGMLTAQIEKGAPFDVFVSANMRYPKKLVESGFGELPEVYAYGRLAVVYKKGKTYNSVEEVLASDKVKRIAIADAKTAPYGMAAKEYLKNSELFEEYKDKIVYGESIGQVNQYLTTGAVDAAFTSYSFIAKFGDKYNFLEADSDYFSTIEQGVLILKNGKEKHPEESRKFVEFLKSDACKDVLTHFGYRIK